MGAGDNPFTHYNVGLIYFDLKNFDQALAQAHKAYGLGFVQPQLRDQLKQVGKWKDPDERATSPTSEAASQGSAPPALPNVNAAQDPTEPAAND